MSLTLTIPPVLIPPPAVVKNRLSEVCAEARLLRRLLQLSRDAEQRQAQAAILITPSQPTVTTSHTDAR